MMTLNFLWFFFVLICLPNKTVEDERKLSDIWDKLKQLGMEKHKEEHSMNFIWYRFIEAHFPRRL